MSEFFVTILNGQIDNKKTVSSFFKQLKDGRYSVRVERSNKRTLNQNAYIHGVLFPELAKALREVGYAEVNNEIAKEWAKRRFLSSKIDRKLGGSIEYTKNTSELTTMEMNEFIDSVIRFAAEQLNYEIPFPNEQVRLNM